MSVMQPATLDHYVVIVGLEHLPAVFEEMYNEATVVMNRTRRGHHFQVQGGHSHDHWTSPRDDDNQHDQ